MCIMLADGGSTINNMYANLNTYCVVQLTTRLLNANNEVF